MYEDSAQYWSTEERTYWPSEGQISVIPSLVELDRQPEPSSLEQELELASP